jgi:lipoate-protein ligase A
MAPSSKTIACATGFEGRTLARLIVDGPLPGRVNMDKDRALLEAVATATLPVVRLFRWSEPTVSHGRTQKEADARAFAETVGVRAVVQRPTGGGMVWHDQDLSFSIAWQRNAPGFPTCIKNVYRALHEALAGALRELGHDVTLYQPVPQKVPGQCFVEPVEADVMWRGRKVVGGALRVAAGARLYQGTLQTAALGLDAPQAQRAVRAALDRLFLFGGNEG